MNIFGAKFEIFRLITAPIAVASTAPVVVATSTAEEKRPIPREKEQPQKTSTVVTETENSVAKTLPPKTEKSEPTPPPATKKEVTSSDETKPPVKVSLHFNLDFIFWLFEKNRKILSKKVLAKKSYTLILVYFPKRLKLSLQDVELIGQDI